VPEVWEQEGFFCTWSCLRGDDQKELDPRPPDPRESWNMFSSMSRLGFSRLMTITSGLIAAIVRAIPVMS